MERICIRIKKFFPNAKVIFATSTSVQSEKMGKNFKRYNEEIEEYNKVAVDIVKKHGFIVNDLYALSKALPEEAHSDAVHYYTSIGTEAFTKQVLTYLSDALELSEVPKYKEVVNTDSPIGI
jgi:protein involved in sex pheromone biosynthesis